MITRTIKLFLLLGLFICNAHSGVTNGTAMLRPSPPIVLVELDYDDWLAPRSVQIPLTDGETAYDILRKAANIEVANMGEHVMVTAIDGVAAIEGKSYWVYKLNGKPAPRSANTQPLDGSTVMRWQYTWIEPTTHADGTTSATTHYPEKNKP